MIRSRFPLLRSGAIAATFMLLSAAAGPAAAERKVSFCFNDWPPYSRMESDGAHGISVAIIREAARRIGIGATFEERPWKRCLQLVRTGHMDAVVDAAERDEFLQGPTSFTIYSDTYWVRTDGAVSTYADLRGKKIGLVEGYRYADRLLAHMDSLELRREYAIDDGTNIRKLAFGRVDGVITDLAGGLYLAKRHALKVHPILPPFSVERLYASFHKKKPALQRRFDRAFAELMADGFVDAVYKRHIGKAFSRITDKD